MAYKVQQITWCDATSVSGWGSIEDRNTDMITVNTVGYVVKETKDYVVQSAADADNGTTMWTISIPKYWIKKRKTLKV